MIEELLHWPKIRSLEALAERFEELNREFTLLDLSLANGQDSSVPNLHLARSLRIRLGNLMEDIQGTRPRTAFGRLYRKNLIDSIFAQQEYINFFFTRKYNQQWGVRNFLNYAFLPEADFSGKPEPNGAMAVLESMLRSIDYRAITRRQRMMADMLFYESAFNPADLEAMVLSQLPRLRQMVSKYDLDMGFETQSQVSAQAAAVPHAEHQQIVGRLHHMLDMSDPSTLATETAALLYNLVFQYSEFCFFDWTTRTMEVNVDRFHFYTDPETGQLRFYSGDLDASLGHENYHRLQGYFSRFMPPGLRHYPGEFNPAARVIVEGAAYFLEQNFMAWLRSNRDQFGISEDEIEIASLDNPERFGNRLIRLCHSLYHRELMVEGKDDYDAHVMLAKVSGNPALIDDEYLNDESVHETLYFAFYFFGGRYIADTMNRLKALEKRRLRSEARANDFLARNEPLVIQGLLTGNWTWSTHQEWFLQHYWPKARRYAA